ncbi:MAG: tetratricopeptide repeat protein [Candidatus Dadabacteria bacterium]|nr:tetratricopeptide repeat protein [Candidatus Dadabacteria bacterium]
MRKKYLAVAAVLFSSVFMYGCVASEGDLDFLYSRQREAETNIKKMQKDIDWLKAEVKKEDNILNLNEKTFEFENKLLELEQIIGKMHAQSEERFKKIETGLSAEAEAKSQAPVPQPQAPPAAPSEQASESPGGEPATEPAPAEKDLKENYELGLKKFADGNYEAARALLREYLAAAPRSDEAADAMFLIADSYFKEKFYEEAILEYQNIIETWPASPKIPLCQLNQGIALLKIGKPNEASLFFESLIEAYPDSPEAATAKEHLKTLSTPGE